MRPFPTKPLAVETFYIHSPLGASKIIALHVPRFINPLGNGNLSTITPKSDSEIEMTPESSKSILFRRRREYLFRQLRREMR